MKTLLYLFLMLTVITNGAYAKNMTPKFDWKKPIRLIEGLIKDVQLNKDKEDSIVVAFTKSYSKLEAEFNDIFYKQKNRESLTTGVYLSDIYSSNDRDDVTKEGKAFYNAAKQNGFYLLLVEGTELYFIIDNKFILKRVENKISAPAFEFLTLYYHDKSNPPYENGNFALENKELFSRISNWSHFVGSNPKNAYSNIPTKSYKSNLYIMYDELMRALRYDAQPMFELYVVMMRKEISEDPSSLASKEFQDFIKLWESEGSKVTAKVKEYITKKLQ